MNLDRVSSGLAVPDDFNVIIDIPMNADPVKSDVDKATGAPLATGAARGVQELSGLWQGDADASLAGLTELFSTGGDGVLGL